MGTSRLKCLQNYCQDFPFDRHVIRLQNLDFVWRSYKDDDDFFDSMKIATSSNSVRWYRDFSEKSRAWALRDCFELEIYGRRQEFGSFQKDDL